MQEIRWRPTSSSLFWSPSSMGNEKSTLEMLLCFCRWSSRISNQFIARKLESFHTRSPIFLDCQRKSWSSMETHRRNLTISKVSSYVTPREGLLLSYGLGVNKEKKKNENWDFYTKWKKKKKRISRHRILCCSRNCIFSRKTKKQLIKHFQACFAILW